MKNLKNRAIAIVLTIVASLVLPIFPQLVDSAEASSPQFRSTYGTEFWVTFDMQYQDPPTAAKIYLASVTTASATITWADKSTQSVTISASSVATVNAIPKWRANTLSDGVAVTGIKIESDVAISVYLLNNEPATSDASIAYPTPYLGQRYRLVAAPNSLNSLESMYPTRFSVLATTDSTVVTISPSVAFGSRTTASYQVQLNAGEVYTAASGEEIVGTLIESDKPVQVSGSNGCANLGRLACDHLVEFMTPTITWGKEYIVAGTPNTDPLGDRYLILSDQDNTDVFINGQLVNLAEGGDFHLFTGSFDDSNGRGDVITSSKPVLVMQFIDGGNYGNPATSGDPAMVLIPSVEQFLNDAIFTTPADGFSVNSVTVIAKTTEVGVVALDGEVIPASSFSAIAGTEFSSARIFISLGTHRIKSTTGIGVFSYGYNPADSYAYSAGSGLVDLVANPGGVAAVGYLSVETIAQAGNASPSFVAPVIETRPGQKLSITFKSLSPEKTFPGRVVTISGQHLDEIVSLSIDGVSAKLVNQSFSTLSFRVPTAISVGMKELNFSTNWGRHSWAYPLEIQQRKPIALTRRLNGANPAEIGRLLERAKALVDNHDKVRCIVNNANLDTSALAKEICSRLVLGAAPAHGRVLEPRKSFEGKGLWVRIWLGYQD